MGRTRRREGERKERKKEKQEKKEKREKERKKKARISGNTGSANWSLVRAIEEAMQHGIWGRYRERITCCIRNDGVGATEGYGSKAIQEFGGVETTLDRSCSGQREWLYLLQRPVIGLLPLLRLLPKQHPPF